MNGSGFLKAGIVFGAPATREPSRPRFFSRARPRPRPQPTLAPAGSCAFGCVPCRWPNEAATGSPSVGLILGGERPTIAGHSSARLRDYAEDICRSGLPGLRELHDRALRAQLDGYVSRI